MKRLKQFLGVLVAAIVLTTVPASVANAAPFNLEVTDAVLDLGGLKNVKAIDSQLNPPDPPATLTGDLTGSDITVPKAGFVFPPKTAEVSAGINAVINMEANEDITGTFDAANGKMVLDASLKASVDVLGSHCVISPIVLTLSTENFEPYLGRAFAAGITGPGAVSAKWEALPPITGGGSCGIVSQLITGPGGIWMAQDITVADTCITDPEDLRCDLPPTVAPKVKPRIVSGPNTVTDSSTADFTFTKGADETIEVSGYSCSLDGAAFEPCDSGSKSYSGLADGSHTFKVKSTNIIGAGPEATHSWSISHAKPKAEFGPLSVKPVSKSVKAGKKTTFTAKIKNVGDGAASGVKICVSAAPKKLVSVKKCQTVGNLAAGKTATAKFKVTVKKKAKKGKKATLKFKATGTDLAPKTATAKVKVK